MPGVLVPYFFSMHALLSHEIRISFVIIFLQPLLLAKQTLAEALGFLTEVMSFSYKWGQLWVHLCPSVYCCVPCPWLIAFVIIKKERFGRNGDRCDKSSQSVMLGSQGWKQRFLQYSYSLCPKKVPINWKTINLVQWIGTKSISTSLFHIVMFAIESNSILIFS